MPSSGMRLVADALGDTSPVYAALLARLLTRSCAALPMGADLARALVRQL